MVFTSPLIARFFHGPAVSDDNSAFNNVVSSIAEGAMAAFLAWRLPALSRRPWREIGFRRPARGDWIWVLAALFVSKIVLRVALSIYLSKTGQTHHQQAGFENFAIRSWLERATAFLEIAVMGPIAEELLFRGLVLNAFASRFGTIAAVVFSGILFGELHGDDVFFPVLALDGIIFGALYVHTRNLTVSTITHGLSNAIALL